MTNNRPKSARNSPERTNAQDLRSSRLSALLAELWQEGSLSRARLGEITGMTLPSVTRFVQEFMNAGVIIETGKGESSGGRQPALLCLNPDLGVVIGLDFSGIELRGAIFDGNNRCLQVIQEPFQSMQVEIFEKQVVEFCGALFASPAIQNRPILGIGVSVPGTVDTEKGLIRDSSNLRLRGYPIGPILTSVFNVPVFVEHDTSVAALAEKYCGAGKGHPDLVYITISTGIGAGIIINDEIYRGATGQAGEFGHVTIERDGQVCACGKRGCLEAVAAVPAMLASAHSVYQRQGRLNFDGQVGAQQSFSLQDLSRAVEQEDSVACAILNRSADHLALAISMLVSIIDIRLMIIGGEVLQMGGLYFDALRSSLQKYQAGDQDLQIVPALLGESAALQGAGMVVMQRMLGE